MSSWVKNAVMLLVTSVWAIVVLTNLVRGILPDPLTWGVPGGMYFTLNPNFPGKKKNNIEPDRPTNGVADL